MKPFLKWTGGKYRLLEQLEPLLPQNELCKRGAPYIEPFVGSGAMYFHLAEARITTAVLCDLNAKLISTYAAIQLGKLQGVIGHLRMLKEAHDREAYYAVRENFNDPKLVTSPESAAARFIYLNKTCFNGVWRVNKAGLFNVPIGDYKDPQIFDPVVLEACREALQYAKLLSGDFAAIVRKYAQTGSFVYLDPPYEPVSRTANFRGYTKDGGNAVDLASLRSVCAHLDVVGARFMLSNSDVPRVREAFKHFDITRVQRSGTINSDASKRGDVAELVIRNYR